MSVVIPKVAGLNIDVEALVSTAAVKSHAQKHHVILWRCPAKGEASQVGNVHNEVVVTLVLCR